MLCSADFSSNLRLLALQAAWKVILAYTYIYLQNKMQRQTPLHVPC